MLKITPEIIAAVEESISHMSGSPFSWPDDGCWRAKWAYELHIAWVMAWNASGRAIEAVPFLRNWLQEQLAEKAVAKEE